MPVTVVCGGQYGSEGKGKVTHYLSFNKDVTTVVRVGGPNSGHTSFDKSGKSIILRQLPVAATIPHISNILPAGSYINLKILLEEIELTKVSPNRLLIDPNAVIISDEDIENEKNGSLGYSIGSTCSGVGSAVKRRIDRFGRGHIKLAGNEPRLYDYIRETDLFMRNQLDVGNRIIIEGTQGFGLSLLHSDHYPFVTSRDTSAAGFVSEAGLSPLDVDDIVLVIRSHPIRVGGYSGPLSFEMTWDELSSKLGRQVIEYTSVTKRVRRIAYFDYDVVRKAIRVNKPTRLVMNHVDYIDKKISEKTLEFINYIEHTLNTRFDFFGLDSKSLLTREEFESLYNNVGIFWRK